MTNTEVLQRMIYLWTRDAGMAVSEPVGDKTLQEYIAHHFTNARAVYSDPEREEFALKMAKRLLW